MESGCGIAHVVVEHQIEQVVEQHEGLGRSFRELQSCPQGFGSAE